MGQLRARGYTYPKILCPGCDRPISASYLGTAGRWLLRNHKGCGRPQVDDRDARWAP